MTQYVYSFGGGKADGTREMKSILGGKGANLADMTTLGIPVPPGFTITTGACAEFLKVGNQWPEGLQGQVDAAIKQLEELQGQALGTGERPLLVSVRSGAAVSMPGMMDTVLNLGLNDQAVEALAKASGNARMAYDSYRRLIEMFGDVAMDIPRKAFEAKMTAMKAARGAKTDAHY